MEPKGNDMELEALARAYDKEDSAQRGEPSPWDIALDDAEWRTERLACAEVAIEAYNAARLPKGNDMAGDELVEAATELTNFAWSVVVTDCRESSDYLNGLVDNVRSALARLSRSTSTEAVAGWKLVPIAALEWLNGEAPDPAGLWFGDFPDDHPKPAGAFWWRKQFADIISYYDLTHSIGETGGTATDELVAELLRLNKCDRTALLSSNARKTLRKAASTLTSLRAERDAAKQLAANIKLWLRHRAIEAGYTDEVSFDAVWDDVRSQWQAAESSLAAEKLLREQAEEKANDVAAAWARDAEFEALEQRAAALVGALKHDQWEIIAGALTSHKREDRDPDYTLGIIEYGFIRLIEAKLAALATEASK